MQITKELITEGLLFSKSVNDQTVNFATVVEKRSMAVLLSFRHGLVKEVPCEPELYQRLSLGDQIVFDAEGKHSSVIFAERAATQKAPQKETAASARSSGAGSSRPLVRDSM